MYVYIHILIQNNVVFLRSLSAQRYIAEEERCPASSLLLRGSSWMLHDLGALGAAGGAVPWQPGTWG